jgi:uncharacterized protein (TIGR02996 family)
MPDDAAFRRAILADPRDDVPWLICADWLEDRGDPLAAAYRCRRLTNSIGMELVLIPPGTFLMGSPPTEEGRDNDEGPQHEVTITRPFYVGVYQVTQEEYERVMGSNPSWFSASGGGKDKVKGKNTRRFPIENVSWDDAVEFCRRLSGLPEEKHARRLYRLPTEAEWEYSCRGGASDSKPFYFKEPMPFLCSTQANFEGNYPYGGAPKGEYLERTTTVGSYQPNAFGLYDMHGNIWEWCSDWYGEDYYNQSPLQDPQGPQGLQTRPSRVRGGGLALAASDEPDDWPPIRQSRVLRGGSWHVYGRYCRAASRGGNAPSYRCKDIFGFRMLLVAGAGTA